MSFTKITGDLFDPSHGFDAVGHGVNLQGVMGAGIAKTISSRWPGIMPSYREACRTGALRLGSYQRYEDPDGTVIYNLATQARPGRNARFAAVRHAVDAAVTDCEEQGYRTLGLPQIGCGIGGLDWADVSDYLSVVASNTSVDIVAVTFEPSPRSNAY